MDFQPPILSVTCGQVKGLLYKDKIKQGEFPGLLHFQLQTIRMDKMLFGEETPVSGVSKTILGLLIH